VETDAPEQAARSGRPRSEKRKAAILAAAGDLMMEGGLRAATMEAIAARAGVGKATVYKWWPSRGAVALEGFMLRAADSWTLPEGVSAAEALRILAVATVRLFTGSPAGPLMRALAADAQSDPEIAKALREQWFAPRRAVAAEIVREGMRSGDLRADLDLPATLDLVFAPVYYRLLFSHEPLDEAFAERTVAQALAGIAGTADGADAPGAAGVPGAGVPGGGNSGAGPVAQTERSVQ
jgi:AcrR family transcriptional regulator